MYPSFRNLILIAASINIANAAEFSITPFKAAYTLSISGTTVGKSEISLQQDTTGIRWQLSSRATGIYALLTDKKPYAASVMECAGGAYRLTSVLVSENPEQQPEELAQFDWAQNQLDLLSAGEHQLLRLKGPVFDYLSVHWLAAQMTHKAQIQTEFSFYNDAELEDSTLTSVGISELTIHNEPRSVQVYEQNFPASETKHYYHYDLENPLLPLKIEIIKADGKTSIILFDHLMTEDNSDQSSEQCLE